MKKHWIAKLLLIITTFCSCGCTTEYMPETAPVIEKRSSDWINYTGRLNAEFAGMHLGCSIEEATNTLSSLLVTKNITNGSKETFVYNRNDRFPEASNTVLTFYNKQLIYVGIIFKENLSTDAFSSLKSALKQKFSSGTVLNYDDSVIIHVDGMVVSVGLNYPEPILFLSENGSLIGTPSRDQQPESLVLQARHIGLGKLERYQEANKLSDKL